MTTGISDYRKMVSGEKEITLPSGAVFRIRKIRGRDYLKTGAFPVKSTVEIARSGKSEDSIWTEMSEEDRKKMIETMDSIITIAVKEPRISLKKEEGKLCVDELSDEDYYFLVNEINSFSIGGQENLRPFRDGKTPAGAGRSGEEIRDASARDNE